MTVGSVNNFKYWISLFSAREWFAAALILSISLVGSLFAGYRYTYLQESTLVDDTAEAVASDIHNALSNARIAINKFSAAHRGLENEGEGFNDVYARLFLTENPAISSLGSFEYRFDWLQPVQQAVSKNLDDEKLQGINLAGTIPLREAIATAVSHNGVAYGVTPVSWLDDADVLLVQPQYQFAAVPPFNYTLEESVTGGFWMSISLKGLTNGFYADPDSAKMDSLITVTHANPGSYGNVSDQSLGKQRDGQRSFKHKSVFSQYFPSDRIAWFSGLFQPISSSREIFVGGARFKVKVDGQPGFSITNLLVGLVSIGFILTITLISLFMMFNRRLATMDKINAMRAVTRERAKAERALNSITETVISLDEEHRISYINRVGTHVLGASFDQLSGMEIQTAVKLYETDNSGALFNVNAAIDTLNISDSFEKDVLVYDENHQPKSMRLSITNATDRLTKNRRYTVVLRDVSEERTLTRELEYQANHDSLTGIWNRYYFENRLKQLVERAQLGKTTHALVYMDLDQFKIVNDTCGHAAGDRLLCELTSNLKAVLRPGDVLARLGGDEFGLLIVNTDQEESLNVAKRIYSFFQNSAFYHEKKAFPVRASIGYVFIDECSRDVSEVLSAADMACYSAKDGGRNSLNIYSEDNTHIAQQHEDMNWLPRLQNALKNDLFTLHLQAVADTKTEEIKHYEFLLRLKGDNGELIMPNHFIQAAERYDLMRAVDRWVVKEATRLVACHHEALGGKVGYSINLSGQSAADVNFSPYIEKCLEESGVEASCLWFEITETAAITHFQVAVQLFLKLRSLGAKVALDDFGSGLSSFGYLKNLPVDVVKIDGQFVRNIETDVVDQAMVRAIHQVSETMNIESVAEFVESKAALQQLAEIGVHLAQGYVIAKPCTVEDAIAQYQQRNNDGESGFSSAA